MLVFSTDALHVINTGQVLKHIQNISKGQPVLGEGAAYEAQSTVELSLGRKANFVYLHSETKQTRESVQSCRVRQKHLPSQQGSYSEEVSLPDLTKIIRYGNPLSLIILSHYECDEVPCPFFGSWQCCGSVTFWYRSGSVPLEYRIRLRIQLRILLSSSVAFRMATKNYFFP